MANTIQSIVEANLCTGCGVCVSEDPSALKMEWDDYGFLVPKTYAKESSLPIKVCPFNPNPEPAIQDEDKIASIFLKDSHHTDPLVGNYTDTYIGFSNEFRKTSSSGGIATYVFKYLLDNNIVDHLFIVKETKKGYVYQLFSNVEDITSISKTRYYPVTMEELFINIKQITGKVAISGVACFLKAVRLKQYYHPELRDKIPFLIGIICGGWKSSFFTDYLAQRANIKGRFTKPQYRIKDENSTASDYSFGAIDSNNQLHTMKMKNVGDMWGTGMFKKRACDFCTDVLTELSDISLGDAWLPEYRNEGLGNSVIVTRSLLADKIIKEGIKNSLLSVKQVNKDKIVQSQKSSFTHRQDAILFRTKVAQKNNQLTPFYRKRVNKDIHWSFKLVQLARENTRFKSLEIWKKYKDDKKFVSKMFFHLKLLNQFTKLYHKIGRK